MIHSKIPSLPEISLLPDSHPMLARRMEIFNFDSDPRNPRDIANLITSAMKHFGGIGLAANQIGLECRAFAMMLDDAAIVLFNPMISELSAETISMEEGCLTFPNMFLKIARPEQCSINYHDPDGNRQSLSLHGLAARCAQHETDHLNGVLMTSKVSRLKLDMAKKKAKKRT